MNDPLKMFKFDDIGVLYNLDNCYKSIQKSYTASVLYYIFTQDSMTCCYQRLKNIIIDRRRLKMFICLDSGHCWPLEVSAEPDRSGRHVLTSGTASQNIHL